MRQLACIITGLLLLGVCITMQAAGDVKPVVTLYTMPGCKPCDDMKRELAGAGEFTLDTVSESGPYTFKSYPTCIAPGRRALVGYHTKAAVLRWLRGK